MTKKISNIPSTKTTTKATPKVVPTRKFNSGERPSYQAPIVPKPKKT